MLVMLLKSFIFVHLGNTETGFILSQVSGPTGVVLPSCVLPPCFVSTLLSC